MQFILATFNTLHPEFAVRHSELVGLINGTQESNWQTRKVNILKGLIDSKADIIGLQEISKASIADLTDGLIDAGFGVRHVENPKGDGGAIIYKNERFSELHFKVFDLDEEKRACFIDLKDKVSLKVVRIANCHLQGGPQGPDKGVMQLKLVLDNLATASDYPLEIRAVVGDFNEDATRSHKKGLLIERGYCNDGVETITEPSKNRQIDWIFCTAEKATLTLQDIPIAAFTHPASDHIMKATKILMS